MDGHFNYSCSLLDFFTYNSIPNIQEKNNKFYYFINTTNENEIVKYQTISIPPGSYELEEIGTFLREKLSEQNLGFKLIINKNTFSCRIETAINTDFERSDSVGEILGFSKILSGETEYESDKVVNIQSINSIRVDCDLTTGSFHNGVRTHTIYEFSPNVKPGYKINIQPKNLIYLPVVRRRINTVSITIVDQNGELVNFRGETITCRIHIKKDI